MQMMHHYGCMGMCAAVPVTNGTSLSRGFRPLGMSHQYPGLDQVFNWVLLRLHESAQQNRQPTATSQAVLSTARTSGCTTDHVWVSRRSPTTQLLSTAAHQDPHQRTSVKTLASG